MLPQLVLQVQALPSAARGLPQLLAADTAALG
jgi:hypothetical protein